MGQERGKAPGRRRVHAILRLDGGGMAWTVAARTLAAWPAGGKRGAPAERRGRDDSAGSTGRRRERPAAGVPLAHALR